LNFLQLHPVATTTEDGWSFTPIRNTSASWRTIGQLEQAERLQGHRRFDLDASIAIGVGRPRSGAAILSGCGLGVRWVQ
jgi:hypothetical protein